MTEAGRRMGLGSAAAVLGQMRLQLVGVPGYAVGLPVAAYLLLRLFARDRSRA